MTFARTIRIAEYGVVAAIVALGVLFAASALPLHGNIRIFSVLSGSMAPAIPTGSLVVVRPAAQYAEGDIVTRKSPGARRSVTHRIVARVETPAGTFYRTKGDANAEADPQPVPARDIIGRVLFHIPLLGYPVGYVATPQGFVVLIVVPAVLITYHEVLATVARIERALRRRRKRTARVARHD